MSDEPSPSADTSARDEVAIRLAASIGRINRRIRPSTDDLNFSLLSALASITVVGPLRPRELSQIEVVAAPTMTRILAELERRGLIERRPDPEDGRSFFVESTPAGEDAVARARSERAERVKVLLAEATETDVDRLAAALDALDHLATAAQSLSTRKQAR